jgi:hypothetical protein
MYAKLIVLILSIFSVSILYYGLVKPKVLEPLCLLDTGKCVRIQYYALKNSALIHMQPTGFWVWFNANKAFVYGINTGNVCTDDDQGNKYEAAYYISPTQEQSVQYNCIRKLEDVKKYYTDNNAELGYLFFRVEKPEEFDVYDVLNEMNRKRIINIQQKK